MRRVFPEAPLPVYTTLTRRTPAAGGHPAPGLPAPPSSMRRTLQRLFQLLGYTLTALGAVLLLLWAVRGLRPALACGLLDTLAAGDWAAAYACLDQSDYDPLAGLLALGSGALLWVAARLAGPAAAAEPARRAEVQARNRAEMMRRVRDIWIEGVLRSSLYQEVRIDLHMTQRAGALPWGMTKQRIGEGEQPVAPGTSMAALFDEADKALVILGAPGSGKSTALLDLLRALLERAAADPAAPIPVVLNLSTQGGQPGRQPGALEAWVASELARFYHVPPPVAAAWLEEGELALLLDGLDEVPGAGRAAVVAQIDDYRRRRRLLLHTPLAVCCREAEYAALAQGVAAGGVVRLLPLDAAQIGDYLAGMQGEPVRAVAAALEADAALAELAQSPLLLNVMLLAGGELRPQAEPPAVPAIDARTRVYDAYLRAMLRRDRTGGLHAAGRRGKAAAYAPQDTVRWLRWLAGKMNAQGQTVFLLERMNKKWFNRRGEWLVWPVVLGLASGLLVGLIFGLPSELIGRPVLNWALTSGLIAGLVFGLRDINVKEAVHIRVSREGLVFGVVFGYAFGLIFGFVLALGVGLVTGLFYWPASGLLFVLISGLILGLTFGLVFGLVGGLVSFSTGLESGYDGGTPNAGLTQSLCNGLVSGLVGGLIGGLVIGLITGLGNGLVGGPVFGPAIGLSAGMSFGLLVGLVYWPFFGLVIALSYGLADFLKHYLLRLVLWLDGSLPLRYVRFLDYCAGRVLLRRVGGGYTFIHRTFQEYMAAVDVERVKIG